MAIQCKRLHSRLSVEVIVDGEKVACVMNARIHQGGGSLEMILEDGVRRLGGQWFEGGPHSVCVSWTEDTKVALAYDNVVFTGFDSDAAPEPPPCFDPDTGKRLYRAEVIATITLHFVGTRKQPLIELVTRP